MKYNNYSSIDFSTDEYFIKWIKSPDTSVNSFWENYLLNNPEKLSIIEEARSIVKVFHYKDLEESEAKVNAIWAKINSSNEMWVENNPKKIFHAPRFKNWKAVYKVAAVFWLFFVSIVAHIYLTTYFNTISYETAYGEMKTIKLPDGSVATLNANSKIKYNKAWNDDEVREVWIDGEGFFSVIHTKTHQKFIVHADHLNVEVLGTEFNVKNRQDLVRIVLSTGKVRIHENNTHDSTFIYMKPGELVDFNKGDRKFQKRVTDAYVSSSWRNNRLIFNGTTLLEIAKLLKDNYGLEVTFSKPELSKLRFTGSANTWDTRDLLLKISKSFNIKIKQQDDKVIVDHNN